MRRAFKLLPLVLVASLTACNNLNKIDGAGYYFYTEVNYTIYAKNDSVVDEIKKICNIVDKISDSYKKRDLSNVYDLNQSNDEIEIRKELYYLLECAKEASKYATNFNPLIGSLSDKWKDSLGKENPEPLSDKVIQAELAKISSSSFVSKKVEDTSSEHGYKYYAQRIGEATLDLGAIAKGFALDRIYEVLFDNNISEYLINCGSSSIMLGAKHSNEPYIVSLRDVPTTKFKAQDCVISSSGNDIQGVKIGDTMYSHIINPLTGSAIMKNDAVIVMTNKTLGYLGDALSTSMMMNSVEEIKKIEKEMDVKTIVVKDKKIVYSHPDIGLA
ncbi:MAG: FAD:protein FMN transferase [Bacilli bacterium]|nr:FAD:protein FMN transferase [Bacilli bacterium]